MPNTTRTTKRRFTGPRRNLVGEPSSLPDGRESAISTAQRYTEEIRDNLRYWATWTPGTQLKLGDFGTVDGALFRRIGNVRDRYGVQFDQSVSDADQSWEYSSKGSVEWKVQSRASAQVIPGIPQGSAGIRVRFNRADAVVLAIPKAIEIAVADVDSFLTALLEKADQAPHTWRKNFAVVTEVVVAESATILVSEGSSSEFVATANADLTAGLMSVGDASLCIAQTSSRSVSSRLIASGNVTPMFRGFRIRRKLLTGTHVPGDLSSNSAGMPQWTWERLGGAA